MIHSWVPRFGMRLLLFAFELASLFVQDAHGSRELAPLYRNRSKSVPGGVPSCQFYVSHKANRQLANGTYPELQEPAYSWSGERIPLARLQYNKADSLCSVPCTDMLSVASIFTGFQQWSWSAAQQLQWMPLGGQW